MLKRAHASRWRSYITASLRAGYPKGNVVAQGWFSNATMETNGITDQHGSNAAGHTLELDVAMDAAALSRYVDLMGRTLGAPWRLTKEEDEQLVAKLYNVRKLDTPAQFKGIGEGQATEVGSWDVGSVSLHQVYPVDGAVTSAVAAMDMQNM